MVRDVGSRHLRMDIADITLYKGSVFVRERFLVQVYTTTAQKKCMLEGVQDVNLLTSL
jgi:hypothetical protein